MNRKKKKQEDIVLKQEKKVSKKASKKKNKIPKIVQDSIPYIYAYVNGIFEIEPGIFSKSYLLSDINFKIAAQEDQNRIFMAYGDFLNSFSPAVTLQITIFNRDIDQEKFRQQILLKLRGDGLDSYREEYNEMLTSKMMEGRNNFHREKYLTVSMKFDSIDSAISGFNRLDEDIEKNLKKVTGKKETRELKLMERLSILYEIMNGSERPFYKAAHMDNKDVESFDYKWMKKQRLTTKDIIAPSHMSFNKNYIEMGDKIAKVFYLDKLPTYLSTDALADMCDIPCNAVTSIILQPIAQEKALKMLRNHMTNVNANVIDQQKKAAKSGYSGELISPSLKKAQNDTEKLLQDMTSRNQKMFAVTIIVMLIAENKENMEKYQDALNTSVSKHLCQASVFNYQQEYGFASVLPLCNNKVFVDRLLTTECASIFIPFITEELSQKNGLYYGTNPITNNMILYNRLSSKNASGVILGTPGSGKSFSAKKEIVSILLNTDDDILVIDPEGEYATLAQILNGEVVKISSGSGVHINPLDMDVNYGDENDDPVTMKSDFICSLFETINKTRFGLTPTEVSIIDRCTKNIYQDYLEHMRHFNGSCDREATPVLADLYDELMAQPQPEAQDIATSLELYAIGTQDAFAHRTNVNLHNRFVVYNIKDIGTSLKNLGLQVCLNDVWNRVIQNKEKGKRTWFYIDEMHLLTQTETSAVFLRNIYKRARKWGGIPTGLTQNVEVRPDRALCKVA